jgi:hypothetical protein
MLRLGSARTLAAFAERFAALAPDPGADPRGRFTVTDPDYGPVVFHPDGTVEAEGRRLRPKDWSVAGRLAPTGTATGGVRPV